MSRLFNRCSWFPSLERDKNITVAESFRSIAGAEPPASINPAVAINPVLTEILGYLNKHARLSTPRQVPQFSTSRRLNWKRGCSLSSKGGYSRFLPVTAVRTVNPAWTSQKTAFEAKNKMDGNSSLPVNRTEGILVRAHTVLFLQRRNFNHGPMALPCLSQKTTCHIIRSS